MWGRHGEPAFNDGPDRIKPRERGWVLGIIRGQLGAGNYGFSRSKSTPQQPPVQDQGTGAARSISDSLFLSDLVTTLWENENLFWETCRKVVKEIAASQRQVVRARIENAEVSPTARPLLCIAYHFSFLNGRSGFFSISIRV